MFQSPITICLQNEISIDAPFPNTPEYAVDIKIIPNSVFYRRE